MAHILLLLPLPPLLLLGEGGKLKEDELIDMHTHTVYRHRT